MGEEQKMQLFIGSTPIDAVPLNVQEFSIEGLDAEEDSVPLIPEPMSWTATIDASCWIAKNIHFLYKLYKFPRKLKKAIGQMLVVERDHDELNVSIQIRYKTKWQRKAARMVKFAEDYLSMPTKDGQNLIINLKK